MAAMRTFPALILAAAVLAGCASPSAPSAAQLAARVPHCRKDAYQEAPSSYARTEETCTDLWGDQYDFATFASEGDMRAWESQGWGHTCCVQGHLWAVAVTPAAAGAIEPYFREVVRADGGRQVSGP